MLEASGGCQVVRPGFCPSRQFIAPVQRLQSKSRALGIVFRQNSSFEAQRTVRSREQDRAAEKSPRTVFVNTAIYPRGLKTGGYVRE